MHRYSKQRFHHGQKRLISSIQVKFRQIATVHDFLSWINKLRFNKATESELKISSSNPKSDSTRTHYTETDMVQEKGNIYYSILPIHKVIDSNIFL